MMPTYTYATSFEGALNDPVPEQAPVWPDTPEIATLGARYVDSARTGSTGVTATAGVFSNSTSTGQVVLYPPFDEEGYTPPIRRASCWWLFQPSAGTPADGRESAITAFPLEQGGFSDRDGGANILVRKFELPTPHMQIMSRGFVLYEQDFPSGWFEISFEHDVVARKVWITIDGTTYPAFDNPDGWAPYFDLYARIPGLENESGYYFDDAFIEWQVTLDQPVTRLFPRDDGRGMSSAPRMYPISPSERVLGGYE